MAKPLSRKAALAMGALAVYLNPKMAQDAKVDLGAALKNVTAKNWKTQKPKLAERIKSAVEGKLAKDADIEDVVEMLDQLDDVTDEVADVIEAAPAVEKDPAEDTDDEMMARVMEFLRGKLSDEDMTSLEAMVKPGAALDTTVPPKTAVTKPATDNDKVSKAAMDAAIAAATAKAKTEAETQTMARLNAIREAERDVRPYIGDLVIAQDSAVAVYHMALDSLGIEAKGITDIAALKLVLSSQPKPGEAQPKPARPAMDAAAAKSYAERFPNANRLVS